MNINRKINRTAFSTAIAGCILAATFITNALAQPGAENLALGKPAIFSPAPNYVDCTDPEDAKQITEGRYSSQGALQKVDNSWSIWVQKGTVGWQNVKPAIVTIDLGTTQPISGVSFSTGAGTAGVTWPTAIYLAVSDDNQNWRAIGDLCLLSRKNGRPPTQGYAPFRYTTNELHTKGRYIAFAAVATPFVFVDEIEVYKGEAGWLEEPATGTAIASVKDYAGQSLITSAAQRRLYDDIDAIKQEMELAPLAADRKAAFTARLDRCALEAAQMPQLTPDFKTLLPLNDTHRAILAVRGDIMAAQKLAPLTVWQTHRYAWLPFLARPAKTTPKLDFSLLRNEFRSDSLLLTNGSGQPIAVQLQLKNAPQDAQNGWLKVDAVAWTDTSEGTPVADALLPLAEQQGMYTVEVPAGMTRKLWLTVDSSKIPSGSYRGSLQISSGRQVTDVPFTLAVANIAMNTPRLSMCMWDDSNGKGSYGLNPGNREAAIALMRSHFVDTPCATRVVLPWPAPSEFDAEGKLKASLDFAALDEWVGQWPGARRYFVFANVSNNFAGAGMETPEFQARVGSWAAAIAQHMRELKLKPQQMQILLVDEPYRETQDAVIAAWAKAINAAAPDLTLFSDPRWKRPDQTKNQDALTQMDILCPALPTYKNGGKAVQEYFQNLRAQGKELWFYQTNGPSWRLDPQLYYRYQPWHAFEAGASGQGFWSFGDIGKAPTSWNGYSNPATYYAPAFIDKNTVYNTIHWDAVREGMQDYEQLAMLRDAIAASRDTTWKQRAQKVLDESVDAITGIWNVAHYATGEGDPTLADRKIGQVKKMLLTRPE